jgi:hypothetical protein
MALHLSFYKTMRMIMADVMGITSEDSLIILYDSRTPLEIPRVYSSVAADLGAEAAVVEIPRPPTRKVFHLDLPKPIGAGLKSATKIIDSWITYTPVLADAVDAGVHMLFIPSGPDSPEMLVRAVGDVDMEKMEKEAARIAELWTNEDEITITSDLGTNLKVDISGVEMPPTRFPPATPKKGEKWMTFTPWGYTGGSVKNVEGTLVVNGRIGSSGIGLMWEAQQQPITLKIKDNRIVKADGGGSSLWPMFENYLRKLNDPNVWGFPAHGPGIGLNPNARKGGPAEWERVRGCIVFGVGDNSVLRRFKADSLVGPAISAPFHWDFQLFGVTLEIGDTAVIENGEIKV